MQRIKDLAREWKIEEARADKPHEVCLKVSRHDYARLRALADLYPAQEAQKVWGDLIHAALNDLEESFPYMKGEKVVGEDELGDPLYEDTGLTPRFEELTRKYNSSQSQES